MTDTPMVSSIVQSQEQGTHLQMILMNVVPLDRMGNPYEITNTVTFLASDDSGFVTGIELFVDAGMAQI
jgi:NAD(P)-dependent dehydrogenase (short-subunit alcohol dehydrogenase family)